MHKERGERESRIYPARRANVNLRREYFDFFKRARFFRGRRGDSRNGNGTSTPSSERLSPDAEAPEPPQKVGSGALVYTVFTVYPIKI